MSSKETESAGRGMAALDGYGPIRKSTTHCVTSSMTKVNRWPSSSHQIYELPAGALPDGRASEAKAGSPSRDRTRPASNSIKWAFHLKETALSKITLKVNG